MNIQYFKVKKDRQEYLGERYFKVDFTSDSVIQACIQCGEVKRGKGNYFGVYLIGKLTFFSNYLAQSYVEQITKQEYEKHLKKTIKLLS